jgi:hypothetical protein
MVYQRGRCTGLAGCWVYDNGCLAEEGGERVGDDFVALRYARIGFVYFEPVLRYELVMLRTVASFEADVD